MADFQRSSARGLDAVLRVDARVLMVEALMPDLSQSSIDFAGLRERVVALADEADHLRHSDDSTCVWRIRAGDLRVLRSFLLSRESESA